MDPVAQSATPVADESGEVEEDVASKGPGLGALDALDDTLDRALGSAATGLWGLASAVSAAVPAEAQAALAGRGARGLAGLSSAARGVAATVQRNAAAVEEALIASAAIGASAAPDEHPAVRTNELALGKLDMNHDDGPEKTVDADDDALECPHEPEGRQQKSLNEGNVDTDENKSAVVDLPDAGFGVIANPGDADAAESLRPRGYVKEDLDVNAELARAARNLKESVVGKTVGGLLGSLSMWAAGDDESEDDSEIDEPPRQADAPASRFESLLRELELNPDTYCEPAADLDGFAAWVDKEFDLDKLEDRCVALLDRHPSIAELYERVVPRVIEEETFWMRYFYALHVLNAQEEERRKLLERAVGATGEDADADAAWDDDDDEDEEDASGNQVGDAAGHDAGGTNASEGLDGPDVADGANATGSPAMLEAEVSAPATDEPSSEFQGAAGLNGQAEKTSAPSSNAGLTSESSTKAQIGDSTSVSKELTTQAAKNTRVAAGQSGVGTVESRISGSANDSDSDDWE